MPQRPDPDATSAHDFERAGRVLRILSAPIRLRIVSSLCEGEKNVGQLLLAVPTTQPNMSQHLKVLHDAQIIAKRRDGVQVHYRIHNDRVVDFCQVFCALVDEQAVRSPADPEPARAATIATRS